MHAPRTGETFTASEGRGATRNGIAISVGSVTKLSEAFAVASIGFGATKKKDSRFVALNSTCARLRVLGSAALEMCYVAMGTFDLFVHEFLSPWDIAALGVHRARGRRQRAVAEDRQGRGVGRAAGRDRESEARG